MESTPSALAQILSDPNLGSAFRQIFTAPYRTAKAVSQMSETELQAEADLLATRLCHEHVSPGDSMIVIELANRLMRYSPVASKVAS